MKYGHRISKIEYAAMVMGQTLAFGLFIFPNDLSSIAGGSSLYAFVFVGVLGTAATWVMNKLVRAFPGQTVGELFPVILGNVLGTSFLFALLLGHLVWLGMVVRVFSDLFATLVLRETPLELILFFMLLGACYTAFMGIETLGRFSVIVMTIVYVTILFVFILAFKEFDPAMAKPLFEGVWPIVRGGITVFYVLMGIQMVLVAFAFTDGSRGVTRASYVALWSMWVLLMIILIAVNGVLGMEAAQVLNWPGVLILRLVEIPGTFVERLGLFILLSWTAAVFALCANLLFGLSVTAATTFRLDLGKARYLVIPLAISAYWFAIIPQNHDVIDNIVLPGISYIGLVTTIGVPMLMLLIARLRGLNRDSVSS